VQAGTIHALLGENGAGKSTAMKILFGMVKPDSGTIRYDGKAVEDWNPRAANELGIGMVHQHFMLAGPETVHDNLVLGIERKRLGFFRDRAVEARELEALMRETGLRVPLDALISSLPIGLQSRCEILKVLYRKARFLILDEPTAVLTPQQIEDFLNSLKSLRERGHTVLIVTHKLKEVMAIADEVTVLRAGKTIATRKASDTTTEELSELMVGRRVQLPRATRQTKANPPIVTHPIELRPGEIAGIAGVEGNGQEELIQALSSPDRKIVGLPLAVIPADRHREGLILDFTLTENMRLGRRQLVAKACGYFGSISDEELVLLNKYDVRPSKPELAARALSGGNQQKLIVARELGDLPTKSVVLAVHPTRGVDVGAIEFIHGRLLEAARAGAAILLISSELDELMALSHRIGVIDRGKITTWFEGPPYNEKEIGLAMLGGGRA
jgi:simple sugar transport system ATP-binding protein